MAKPRAWLLLFCMVAFPLREVGVAKIPCPVIVRSSVQVQKSSELVLSDLLDPHSCADVLQKATQISIGKAPLVGSARVLDREQADALLHRLFASGSVSASVQASVPERIVIRSADKRSSCAAIASQILGKSPEQSFECGAEGRIPEGALVQVRAKFWDPALRSWEFVTRCQNPEDCVPFTVRSTRSGAVVLASAAGASSVAGRGDGDVLRRKLLVRAGEKALLIWEADGIRSATRVLCLNAGGKGDRVRVRPLTGGGVLNATVEAEKTLQREP